MERGELREVDRQEEIKTPKPQFPTPKSPWELEVGSWEFASFVSSSPQDPNYLASGFGRIWNFTSLLVVPLPPSTWNGARVEYGV